MSTDKTKMSNLESYQELTIQISTLNLKLDAILKLLNKPEIELTNVISVIDHRHVGAGTFDLEIRSNPLQWPNESRTDYMKRIGQYNEAQSDDEQFTENFK